MKWFYFCDYLFWWFIYICVHTCSADEDIDSKYPTNIVVYSSGRCNWVPLGIYISSCSIDIRWFPFDDQHCKMKFGSWTYDGNNINLTADLDYIDTSTYQPSGEWMLIGTSPRPCWNNVDLMLGQRRRRWANIKSTLAQSFVFAV